MKRTPDMHIQLGYKDVFTDFDKFDILKLVENIPSVKAIEYIVNRTNKVVYAFSDYKTQKELIEESKGFFKHKAKYRIGLFLKRNSFNNNYATLFQCQSTFLFIKLMLQNNNQTNRDLTKDDIKDIYVAYFYCAQLWTDKQLSGVNNESNLARLALKIDLPIIEFKMNKDFRVQLYKANQFFKFCENDKIFSVFLSFFYKDNKVDHYKDYLLTIFNLYKRSLDDDYIDISGFPDYAKRLVEKYTIDIEDCADIWVKQDFTKLRDHFFIKIKFDKYLLTNANFLIDKFYQGLIFDFWQSVSNNKGVNGKGKVVKDFGEFRAMFGATFSEEEIMYDVLNRIFSKNEQVKFEGHKLREYGNGEPDFYVRDNNNVFLFEYKDLILGDDVKKSDDCNYIIDEILKRICKEDGVRKGGAQLLHTIDNITREGYLDLFDPDQPEDINIYPILITTDRAFDALGVSYFFLKEFNKIAKDRYGNIHRKIKPPVLINIDTLFLLITIIQKNEINFNDVLNDYIVNYNYRSSIVVPFSTFAHDYYRKDSYTEDEVKSIFDGLFDTV